MHRALSLAALLAMAVALAGCGAAASPSPSASAAASTAASPSAAPTDAAPSASATASDEAGESAAPSDDASAAPSFEVPSFSLPSGAKDLEAVLPDELCGADSLKLSFSGADIAAQADEDMQAVLDEIGAEASDVSMAVAASASAEGASCAAGIMRIAGANTDEIQAAFLSATEEGGDTVEEQQIGGRTVFSVGSDGETQHVYFTGDAIVFVSAPEAELESLLSELP